MKNLATKLFILFLLAGTTLPVSANLQSQEIIEEVTEVVPALSSTEQLTEDTVPRNGEGIESKITRKMTQAEKARNAAENDGWGGAITIIAMCIVISALAVLSILFLCFGKISQKLMTKTKKKAKEAALHEPTDNHELASGEVIAAISLALSQHFGEGHDVEDTILTIRRMQKAYSPWNSKIYNLRNTPQHHQRSQSLSPES